MKTVLNGIPLLSVSQVSAITSISQSRLYKVNSGARDTLTKEEKELLERLRKDVLFLLDEYKQQS